MLPIYQITECIISKMFFFLGGNSQQTPVYRPTTPTTMVVTRNGKLNIFSLLTVYHLIQIRLPDNNQPPPPANCQQSLTRVGDQVPCSGDLIFEDNFDFFDGEKWRIEQRFSKNPVSIVKYRVKNIQNLLKQAHKFNWKYVCLVRMLF